MDEAGTRIRVQLKDGRCFEEVVPNYDWVIEQAIHFNIMVLGDHIVATSEIKLIEKIY